MKQKLRLKFISATMLSVIAVLTVILGVINIINYRNISREADALLQILADNHGVFPGMEGASPALEPVQNFPPEQDGEARLSPGGPLLPEGMSPEAPFETRYFSILVGEEGEVIRSDLDRIAAVDALSVDSYAEKVREKGQKKGFLKPYRYLVVQNDGASLLLFVDCTRSLRNFRSFCISSLLIAAVGIVSIFLLTVLLSARVIRPFAEAYEKQRRFITDAGHELKTPLAIIDADATVLEMDLEENEWLADIRLQAKRLKGLTEDLIYLARMEEVQEKPIFVDFPLSELVAQTALSFRSQALAQNKSLVLDIDPDLSYYGDSKGIEKLCSILLDNSLKYSLPESEITLTLKRDGRGICLCVENACEEIRPEETTHLFARFYRRDPSRNSQTGGYGIGLSIAQAIVAAHKGKVWASSPDGHHLRVSALLG